MPLRLIIEDDEGATTIVPLGKEAITIGRQQGNTIQLTEKNVSRTHARLFPESEAWMIEDLNSYNGIKVNDKSVEGRTKLNEGDIVQIGDYHLAITEDVDKRTLNYDRPGQVANDGDPLLASSSSDLPRVAAEEAQALSSSGPQPITPPPSMMLDSGPVPATAYGPGYDEGGQKKSMGLLLLLGIAVLGAGAVGAYMLTRDTNSTDGATASAGKTAGDPTQALPAKAAPAKAPEPVPPPVVVPPQADGAAAEPAPADGDIEPPPEPAAVPTPPVEPPPEPASDDAIIVEEPEPAPVPTPAPAPSNNTKRKKKPPKPPPAPKPAPPVDSGPSADELVSQARKKSFGNPGEAYRLAKQAYGKKPSHDAAALMFNMACRLKDAKKAKGAYSKLRSNRESLKKNCADRYGVEF